ncbi:putative Lipoprotein [Pseudomonas amygdali pv. morsprunorum]|nr:putative Lipoprotein [Pseudomonas amygdali pv. eriobotryae]RMO17212.1 putative Lipoprotein [Pseudomonas amygdali pv. morsprunorum]RMP08572.1 putative Lipoprotein [Pseudomonas syringae pv. persicae]RMQ07854.1 putative Lipoprotein [Pseudomonas viridiflava]RMS87134.1 putative Lipoprotein [Pseudomonas savastanoi]
MLTEEAMNKPLYAALLGCSLLVMAGCDQIESSTKHVVNAAADTAKQAIDETHQAATKAIDEAKQELSVQQPPQSSAETESKTDK